MPINAHPEYLAAEKEYLLAQSLEEKIEKLKRMISFAPGHKGAENLRAQLKTRLKKLQEQIIKSKKSKGAKQKGIKKEEIQVVIVGKTKSGKSSLLAELTNARPKISETPFTTIEPIVGMMGYQGMNIQIIEIPAVESDYFDKGITNSADTVLILIKELRELGEISKRLDLAKGKKIVIFNKIGKFSEEEQRKLSATLSSRKQNFILISTKTKEGLEELKNKIFESSDKIRIYTKEPGKEKSNKPIILNPETSVEEVAEKILKGLSKRVKETKIWGPSSKFPGQKVGLKHKLKDMDVVEFKTS